MTASVRLTVCRNLLDVSRDGKSPLRPEEYDLIVPGMEYVQLLTLHGRDAWDHEGKYRPVDTVKKRLYYWDDHGRLVCGRGYVDRLEEVFTGLGYRVEVVDKSPARRAGVLTPCWDKVAGTDFRPLQREALEAVVDRIEAGRGGILQAVPGFGKTFLLRALCQLFPRARIAISIPDVDNVNKTRDELIEDVPTIGQVGGGVNVPRRVTLYTQGSLSHLAARVDGPEDIDLLWVDEVHKYAADKTSVLLAAATKNAVCFGATATPVGRLDGADAKLEPLFGPVFFAVGWTQAVAAGLVVPITVCWHDVRFDVNPGRDRHGVSKKRWAVWRNEPRNRVIAKVARSYPEGEQVLVLAQFVEHVLFLQKALPEFEVVYALSDQERLDDLADLERLRSSDLAPEAMTRDRRDAMRKAYERGKLKKVICNDVWSHGVSFNQLQVLVRADARSNDILDEQIPGRVSRIHHESGKVTGYVHDFLDQFDRGMANNAQTRRANYRAKHWYEVLPPAGRGGLDGTARRRP